MIPPLVKKYRANLIRIYTNLIRVTLVAVVIITSEVIITLIRGGVVINISTPYSLLGKIIATDIRTK